MDLLQGILSQKIGIFYKTQKWKKEIFDKIAEYYRSIDMIDFLTYSIWDARIVLKDGTTIYFVDANTRSKGQRYTKVIIQQGVNQQIIDTVIRPCVLPFAGTQCYVVDIDNNKVEHW